MIDIVCEVDLNKDCFLTFIFNRPSFLIVPFKCETFIFKWYLYIF